MRHTSLGLFSLVLLSGLVVRSSSATASTCERWENDLDACNVLPQNICSNQSIWTAQNWITFQNWKYSDTAKEACDKYWQKWDSGVYNGISDVFPSAADPTNDDLKDCYMDGTGDGHATPDDTSFYTQVRNETVTRDACCDLTPQGPYTGMPGFFPITRDGSFSDQMRKEILKTNNAFNQMWISYAYRSDAGVVNKAPVKPVGADYSLNPSRFFDVLVARGADLDQYPEVDHIIPRRDSKGCTCGPQTRANAIVISRKANEQMSNNCLDPRRLQILDAYTH